MAGEELLSSLGIMIMAAAGAVLLLRRANVPTIVTYIVTGLVVGPVLGLLPSMGEPGEKEAAGNAAASIEIISEVGIALLLFLVGLELSLEKIRDVGKVALLAGIGQVVFTAAGGFVLAYLLGFTVMESIFLATALTFSSTVVVVKLLDQKKELSSLYGRIAVGIFLVQDLVVIVALTFLAGLGNPEELDSSSIALSLGQAFLGMAILLGVAVVASVWLLPRPFSWAARRPRTIYIWSLGWCFLFVVGAELMHLSPEIGAFLAGISLAQLDCAHDLRRRVHPLMSFFVAVFFISLGVRMELGAAMENWIAAVILSLFVLIGNPFIFLWIIGKSGYSERTSFLTSVTVAQISEFSFVFAALGLSTGLIDESILSLTALVGLVTIGVSSYMILYNHRLYEKVRDLGLLRIFRIRHPEEEEDGDRSLQGHVVVVGMNALGQRLVRELHERGETVLAIDTDARKLHGLPGKKLVGNIDYLSVFDEAAVGSARLAISTLQIEDVNAIFAYRCRRLGVPVAIHAFDRSVVEGLEALEVDHMIDSKSAGASQVVRQLEEAGVLAR